MADDQSEPMRAVLDQKVLDAWAEQLASRRRGTGRAIRWLAISLAAVFGLLLLTSHAVLALLLLLLLAVLVMTMISDRESLHCPNCGKVPLGIFENGPAAGLDFCRHCYYWLVSPYRGATPGNAAGGPGSRTGQ